MNEKLGLGDILVEERLIAPEQLRQAKRAAERLGSPVVCIFLDQGLVDEEDMVEALRQRLQMPLFDPGGTVVDSDVVRVVPYEEAARYRLLPVQIARLGAKRVLRVAMADPLDAQAIEDIEFTTGTIVEPMIARYSHLDEAIRTHYRGIVTKVIPRQRLPSGPPAAKPSSEARPGGKPRLPNVETKQFFHANESVPAEPKVQALVDLLVHKGVIKREEYEEKLQQFLRPEDNDR